MESTSTQSPSDQQIYGGLNGGLEPAASLYPRRLVELQSLQLTGQRRDKLFIYLKLILGATLLVLVVWVLKHPAGWAAPLVTAVALVLAFVLHERVLKSIRYRARLINFYQRGLSRLNNHWAGEGEAGERFLDPAHPYARDLDLFGKGSVFELLCTARTRAGEEKLAEWLLAPAELEAIRSRQAAVRELAPRVDLRESLFALGESVRTGVRPQALARWGVAKALFGSGNLRVITAVFASAWALSLIAWGVWGLGWLALLVSVVNLGWTTRLHQRVGSSVEAIEQAAQDLGLLTATLAYMESQQFTSVRLVQLQSALYRNTTPASAAIRRLQRIVEYLESNENWFVKILDLFVFWNAQLVFAAENWQQQYGPAIGDWLDALGELEALAALSGYAYEHPDDVFAEFTGAKTEEGPAYFEAEGFAHPLIPEGRAIRNDLTLGRGLQLMIISGPNMAGKSTFMRAIGVNILLAQCGAPVRARSLRLSRISVAASICILDSLQGGISRFYAEIRRLKLISDLTKGPLPVFFLLDELLSGTNSHDRLIGTQFIVRSLVEQGAIGIVTTHDLALTQIPNSLPFTGEGTRRAVNCHFEDHIEDGELKFDYKLSPGIVQTSNALVLMRSIGLNVQGEENQD